jgi:hypothetical protein
MKTQLKQFADKINFWNLFIGLAMGFALGMITMEALVPGSAKLIRMYHLSDTSLIEDSLIIK